MKAKKIIVGLLILVAIIMYATAVKAISLNLDISGEKHFLEVGEQVQLKTMYWIGYDIYVPGEPDGGMGRGEAKDVTKECVWTSSNEQVATVDSNGLVTAKSIGTTQIKADYQNGFRDEEFTITVIGDPEGVELVSISFEDENMYNAMLNSLMKVITNKIDETHTVKMTQENINSVNELHLYNCNIDSLAGIENFPNVTSLYISKNHIKDISMLSSLTKLKNVGASANNIGDVSAIVNLENSWYDTQIIEKIEKENREINLPQIFIDAQNSESKLYSKDRIKLYNCTISEDGTKMILNDGAEVATITLMDGEAEQSMFIVKTKDPQYAKDELRTITFNDVNLYKGIANYLKDVIKSKNDEEKSISILQKDLEEITYLSCNNKSIEDISGIENFENLETLYLGVNRISNLEKLKSLYKLKRLFMGYNCVNNLEQIASLTNLEWIYFEDNEITDISPISSLVNLETVDLSGNKISDISVLSGLKHLKYLDLRRNGIRTLHDSETMQYTYLTDQTIEEVGQGKEKIDLPESIKEQYTYAGVDFTYINCELAEDRNSVTVIDKTKMAFLILKGGKLNNSILIIKPSENEQVIKFEDENLYNAMLEKLNDKIIYQDAQNKIISLMQEDIDSITTLELKDKAIVNIEGIQAFKNLEELNLSNNEIKDIPNLSNLTSLRKIDLSYNKVTSLNLLSKLISLTELNAKGQKDWFNFIYYYDAICNLKQLKKLDVSSNGIRYADPIAELTNLEELNISENNLRDVSCLKGLEKLTNVIADKQTLDGSVYNNNYTIDLPQIFIEAQTEGDYYSNSGLELENCVLSEDGTKATVDENVKEAKVTIKEGRLANSTFTIENSNYYDDKILITFNDANMYNAIVGALGEKISDKDDENKRIYMTQENIDSVTNLSLENKQIYDISGIEKFKNLETISLNHNNIADISMLSELSNLNLLYIADNKIQSINSLSSLEKLETLTIATNNISDISVVSNLKKLKILRIGDNNISDLTPIRELHNLEQLAIGSNPINDISVIENLTNLNFLTVRGTDVKDISVLNNLTGFRVIYLENNKIDNISALEKFKGIETLLARSQQIDYIAQKSETEIALPQIFIAAKDNNSVGYTEEEFTLENCTISEDGTKVKVIDTSKEAKVTINGGILDKSFIRIEYQAEEPLGIDFKNLSLSENLNITYVTGIQPKTSVDKISELIETNGEIIVRINDDENSILNAGYLATGYKLIITKGAEKREFVLVVKGDVNGDGDANFNDILQVNKHRLNKLKLTGAFSFAGDVNKDNTLDFKDILQINKFRLKKIDTL